MKKFIILLLFALFCLSVPVLAAENVASIEGYIEDEAEGSLTIVSADGETRAELNVSQSTYIVDAESGLPLALSDLNAGRVIVYYSGGDAVLILGNVQEGITPVFARVEDFELTDEQIVVTVHGGTLLVTIERDNFIDNIELGSDLLMWLPFVTASIPGQATAQRTILLSHGAGDIGYNGYENGNNGDAPEQGDSSFIQPAAVTLADALGLVYADFYTENNVTMVPLRAVAESLGFTVTWNEATRSVSLHHAADGQTFGSVVLGQDTFEGKTLEAVPAIRNERTFVPVTLFEILLGM